MFSRVVSAFVTSVMRWRATEWNRVCYTRSHAGSHAGSGKANRSHASCQRYRGLSLSSNNTYDQTGTTSSIEADIINLLVLTGYTEVSISLMNQMIGTMKPLFPEVPDEAWARFMSKVDTVELLQMIVPIYKKHVTHEEVKQLIVFYETPLGSRLISIQPALALESMIAGEEWGRRLGEQVAIQLIIEGYKPK